MKNIIYPALLFVLLGCSRSKLEISYYENGKVKTQTELKNGVKDGIYLELYRNGNVKLKETWVNGVQDGPFIEYHENGVLLRQGHVTNNFLANFTDYFPSGKISSIREFNKSGELVDAKMFLEDGSRDFSPHSFTYTFPPGDTLQIGSNTIFKARVVNILDSIYLDGSLIITTKFDTLREPYSLRVRDTIYHLTPNPDKNYSFKFSPEKIGPDTIYGQFVFLKDVGEEIVITNINFRHPFFVVKK